MIIRKIRYTFKWAIHFGIGRRYKINMKKKSRMENLAWIVESGDMIELKDVGNIRTNAFEKQLLQMMCEIANLHIYKKEAPSELIEKIRNMLEDYRIGFELLEVVEEIALIGGLYQLAYEIRNCSEKRLIAKYKMKKKIKSYEVIPMFWAYVNCNDYSSAAMVKNKCSILYKIFFKNEIEFLTRLINKESCFNLVKKRKEEDLVFQEKIRGKKILIVGPGKEKEENEKYLKKSEVIVSTAYRNNLVVNKKNHNHISYYNKQILEILDEKELDKYINDLDMAVFKGIKESYHKKLVEDKRARVSFGGPETLDYRGGIYFNILYYYKTVSSMLQKILLDILLFEPEEIYIININLFLSKKLYNDNYVISQVDHNINSMRKTFTIHNIMNMYQITKMLYDRKIIKVDTELQEVLDLGIKKYMQLMEELEKE